MAHGQGRGPAWTAEEDAAIRRAVRANRERGFTALVGEPGDGDGYRVVRTARLADVARAIGRSVDAVRKRAQRIGAYSTIDHTGERARRRAAHGGGAAGDSGDQRLRDAGRAPAERGTWN